MAEASVPHGGGAAIAILMTCHNRREKTLAALVSLQRQHDLPPGTSVRVHLVDAGSSDGTAAAVAEHFPHVEVAAAPPDVFWGEGMRIASRNSCRPGLPDWNYQLWLNDDVQLADHALAHLLSTARQVGCGAVVVGAVRSLDGTRTTYSGRRLRGPSRRRLRGLDLLVVEPTGRPEPCDTYNGNVVLVPRSVRQRVGDIDPRFRHGMGDYDHGFRVRKVGIGVFVTPRHVGSCDTNPPLTGSREPGISMREALRRVTSQRELPCRQWWAYCSRHLWPWAPVLMISPYVRTALRSAVRRPPRLGPEVT